MPDDIEDTNRLVAYIKAEIPEPWTPWPGGRREVEAALIDAVLSIQASYGRAATTTHPATGVHRCIERYAAANPGPLDDLERLTRADPHELATLLGNQQTTGQRTKASAIVEAATNLVSLEVRRGADVIPADTDQARAWTSVRGLGPVTWKYFTMLLGAPGVKADTWIVRFVRKAVDRRVDAKAAEQLVEAAAPHFGRTATELDHAIWAHARRKVRQPLSG
jgi:3-methyladenine DNA glycosylase/8-oxoguanine DNA glycosylase